MFRHLAIQSCNRGKLIWYDTSRWINGSNSQWCLALSTENQIALQLVSKVTFHHEVCWLDVHIVLIFQADHLILLPMVDSSCYTVIALSARIKARLPAIHNDWRIAELHQQHWWILLVVFITGSVSQSNINSKGRIQERSANLICTLCWDSTWLLWILLLAVYDSVWICYY